MATSFFRMGRSFGLKSFQVNLCASWNRLFVASYSSKLGGSQYMDVRRTHVKKAKPKPKLDVAQLLLSLGMKPAARPSTATKPAVKDASRLTKPIAPAPSTAKTSPLSASDPVSAAPPPLPIRPASSSVDFSAAAAAAAAAHLPVEVAPSPATVSGASAETASGTSLPPQDDAASLQADHDTSPVMETLSASAVKQTELTESQSTASQETTGTPVVVDVVEVPIPAEHQPAPSLVDVDASRISETSPFSTMDSESLSDPSPASAVDSLSPSASLPTDSISQAVATTSAEETEAVLREDVTVAAPEDMVSVTQGETDAPTIAPETMTSVIAEVTETLTILQVIPQVSSDAEVIGVESTAGRAAPDEVVSVTSAEDFPLDADTVVLEDVIIPDLTLDLDAFSILEMESFLASASQPKPTAEDDSVTPTPAADAAVPLENSSGLEIASFLEDSAVPDLTPHLEAVSLLEVASFLETVPAVDATDRSKSPSDPTISLEDMTVPDLTPSLEAVSLFEIEEFLQDISAPEGEGGSAVVAAASPQTDLSSDSSSLAADAMSLLEIAPSLKDAAVPDLTAQLEAVSLLEVGQFLESVPDTTAAAATVTTVTSEAASSEASTGTSLPPKDIGLPDAEPQLESVVTPAAEAMSPEGQGATESSPLQPVVPTDISMSSETVAADSITTASKEPVVSMTTPFDTTPLETTAQDMSTVTPEPVASTTPSTDTVSTVTPSDTLLADVLTTPPSDQLTEHAPSTATIDTVTLETPIDEILSTEPLDMLHGETPSTTVSDPLTSATPSDTPTVEMSSTAPLGSVASVTPTDTATSEILSDTLLTPVLTSVTAATLTHTIASEISDTASSATHSAAQHEDTLSTASTEPLISTTTSDPVAASTTILDETPEVVATTEEDAVAHVPQVADDIADEPAAATQQQTPEDAAESLIPAAAVGLTDSPVETQEAPTDVLAGVTTEELSPESIEAHLDPVQRLFLEKIREYAAHKMAGEGRLEDGSEFQHRLVEEEAKLQRLYGGHDLTQFPEFNFPEPNLDEVYTK